ncbi:MAG TPA: hypothetical protein VN644_11410 [Pyrinomonadaceae bacterium]|nr:hypothetical protein [Pyrinomonadaceae bacterium]
MSKIILLITLGFSLVVGGFWAGKAQDPPQTPPQNPSDVRKDLPTATAQTTQMDLSGTYAGTFNCDALGLTGDTTMTITGNDFTLADGRTGRIVTSKTGGYTAVALQLTPTTPTGTTAPTAKGAADTMTTPTVVSMRARKSGKRLTLTSVGGTTMKCSFMPSRNVARNRRNQTMPAATGTEVSNPATPATTPPSTVPTESPSPMPSPESPIPSQTPSPTPSPTASPTPEPTPVPNPSPEPQPTTMPTPVPTPGEPMPSPSPSASPTPSPTPTPTPTPTPKPRN